MKQAALDRVLTTVNLYWNMVSPNDGLPLPVGELDTDGNIVLTFHYYDGVVAKFTFDMDGNFVNHETIDPDHTKS